MINIEVKDLHPTIKVKDIPLNQPFMSGGDGPYVKVAGFSKGYKPDHLIISVNRLTGHIHVFGCDDDNIYNRVRYVDLNIVVTPATP